MTEHRPALRVRSAAFLALAIALPQAAGCSTLFRHQLSTPSFTLYSNQDSRAVGATGARIEQVIQAYRGLFPQRAERIPAPRIVYSADRLVEQRIYTAEVKQEGYYLPLFRLIHLSPQSPGENETGDDATVIFHEMAHHFLISAFPESESCYWLNEGVACALEVSYFTADGRLATPAYHPWLHRQACLALRDIGALRLHDELISLLDCTWFRFHRAGDKTRNYALSWALTYRLLERFEGTWEARVAAILALPEAELRSAIASVIDWLGRDPEDVLAELARKPDLALWALDTWIRLDGCDAERLAGLLLPLTAEESDPFLRREATRLLVRTLNQRTLQHSRGRRQDAVAEIAAALERAEPEECAVICRALDRPARHQALLVPLVALLASENPTLRAESALALARISTKPTITRPAFWHSASEAERRAEIAEWEEWLALQSQDRRSLEARPEP